MFQWFSLNSPAAWWQLLLAFLLFGIIGYGVGLHNGNLLISVLKVNLVKVRASLRDCRERMLELTKPPGKSFDDFKVIEGIGPQIEKVLHQTGIRTYSQLSLTAPERIKEILTANGSTGRARYLETWPGQALLATSGQWKQLQQWQFEMDPENR